MNLVVGATGILGLQIVLDLVAAGRPVRALVRESSDPRQVEALRKAGAEPVVADLKQPESLVRACTGVHNLILTASSTRSRGEGDSIDTVDRLGNLALIAAAKTAGVRHVVFISFPKHELSFPLQDAKRAVEAALAGSGLSYTVLQPPNFWEVWCSAGLGFDVAGGTVRIFGTGEGKSSWVSMFDVSRAAVAALDNPAAKNRVIAFGGPEALSQLEIVRRFEEASGKKLTIDRVPAEALRAQFDGSTDSLERSFAALMILTGEGGWVFDPKEVRAVLGFEPRSIDGFISASVAAVAAAARS